MRKKSWARSARKLAKSLSDEDLEKLFDASSDELLRREVRAKQKDLRAQGICAKVEWDVFGHTSFCPNPKGHKGRCNVT